MGAEEKPKQQNNAGGGGAFDFDFGAPAQPKPQPQKDVSNAFDFSMPSDNKPQQASQPASSGQLFDFDVAPANKPATDQNLLNIVN